VLRIQDVYPGSRILIFTHPGSRISDPGSRIQKQQQKTVVKKFFCPTIFCSHKFHNTEYYFIFDMLKKKIWPNFPRIIEVFAQKIVTKASKVWVWDPGSEIRDPGSGKNLFRIPDPGVKKAPDPGSRTRIRNTVAKWFERLIANAKVAKVLGSIPASTDTVEYEGRQIKQC
jgi:hypothetical protein